MASLLAPPPRRPPSTLLNLDCSADLTSYSRSLGPAAQERPLPLSSDALRAQFETHRENVLRHRQTLSYVGGGGASPAQTPLMGRSEIPSQHQQHQHHLPPAPPSYRQHPSAPHSRTHTPIARDVDSYALGPPPPQPYYHPPPAPPSRTHTPLASTYPPAIRHALEQSALSKNARSVDRNTIYNVVEDVHVKTDGWNPSSQVIGTHKNPHSANLEAAEFMLDTGRWQAGEDQEVVLEEDGMLRLGVTLAGSRGERVSVYVEPGRLRG